MRRLRDIAGDGEPVAVLHQYVAHVAEPTLLAVALAVKLGIDIGRARMGLIRALLATEVALAVAPTVRRRARAVLRPEALHRGPSPE